MSNRFPPLRPPVATARKTSARVQPSFGFAIADLCLMAALLLSLGLALV
jgi:hypothetical protein